MTNIPLPSRQILLLVPILVLALGALTACESAGAPAAEVVAPTAIAEATAVAEPTAKPVPTVVVEPSPIPSPTSEPQQSLSDSVSVHPADLRTGLDDLDPVLEAIASGDAAQIAARMQVLETGCTMAEGLGGPPKCEAGQAEGTLVSVFPLLGSEGTFATAEQLPDLAQELDIAGLFGVYRVTTGPSAEEAYWPIGSYGVVLVSNNPSESYTLIVDQGNIVRLVLHYGVGPEQAFDNGRGEIVIPPLQ